MLLRDLCAVLIRYQIGLLLHESELLLEGIVAFVQGRSRPASATPITTLEFDRELQTRANEAIRGTATAQGPDAPTLTQKLNAAGIRGQQTAPMHDDHFAFSREHRSALPERAAVLDELVSRIRMQCVSLTLHLQEGTLNPGAEMFAATEAAVRDVWVAGGFEHKGISLALAYGALHDITARCQHRYAS